MQSIDFLLVVVPLTVIVGALTGLVYYLARREEFREHKRKVAIQKFLAERSKQQALIRKELENVQSQHENGIIDDMTYERLVNVLSLTQEKLRYEASMLLDGKDGLLAGARLSVEAAPEPEADKRPEPDANLEEQEVCEAKPEKPKKTRSRKKRKTKRKENKNLHTGGNEELQMDIMTEEETGVNPDYKNSPVSQNKLSRKPSRQQKTVEIKTQN
jgi:hypothetical protein